MSTEPEVDYDAPPHYGWRPNRYGRAVAPAERHLIEELARLHCLEVESRRDAYLFEKPSWQGQILRVHWGIVCWPRAEVLRAFTRLMDIMPLPGNYAGLYFKRLKGSELVASKYRHDQRARLEAE